MICEHCHRVITGALRLVRHPDGRRQWVCLDCWAELTSQPAPASHQADRQEPARG